MGCCLPKPIYQPRQVIYIQEYIPPMSLAPLPSAPMPSAPAAMPSAPAASAPAASAPYDLSYQNF